MDNAHHDLDYSKWQTGAVYRFATSSLSYNDHEIASMYNETFFKQVSDGIKLERKKLGYRIPEVFCNMLTS